jgi:hypothetical protein
MCSRNELSGSAFDKSDGEFPSSPAALFLIVGGLDYTRASFYLAPEDGRETAPVSPVGPMLKEDDVVGAIVIYRRRCLTI